MANRIEQWRTHDGRRAAVMVGDDGVVTVHIDVLRQLFTDLGWEEIEGDGQTTLGAD